MLRDLIVKNRSYRRFHEDVPVPYETLRELVDLARLTASGSNRQPLKYVISADPRKNALVFSHITVWATHLRDWDGPEEGERPSAYVVILCDTEVHKTSGIDAGIAAQSIMLGASERGLGGCIFGSVRKEQLREALGLGPRYEVLYVLAIGKPKETVVIESVGPDGDTRYWRDREGVHHVPKRSLDEIIVG